MAITEIKYKPVDVNEKATHGTFEKLMERYEGLSKGTVKAWAIEMRENPDFAHFIDNPTHKIVLVHYEGFRLFFKWKSRNRFKTKKETLAEMLENIKAEERILRDLAS